MDKKGNNPSEKKTFFQWKMELAKSKGFCIVPKSLDHEFDEKEITEEEFARLVSHDTVFYALPPEFINEFCAEDLKEDEKTQKEVTKNDGG
jgi:hypothetical protein